MKKYLNGELVDMAPEEESEILSYRERIMAEMPLNRWKNRMAETDAKIPRALEDIYDVLTAEQKAALPETFKNSVADKKRIRSEKP